MLIERHLAARLAADLDVVPAVGILGPRQVGKSTLARALAAERPSVFLDLQLPEVRERLREPAAYLRAHADELVVLDEIQRAPELFSILRPLIDEDRRPGRFVVLGSASPELMRDASESLAGRIFYSELTPLTLPEVRTAGVSLRDHLAVGGYPDPLLRLTGPYRARWATNYLQTFLTRDLRELGHDADPVEFERLVRMLAHLHGGLLNASQLANSLRVSAPTVTRYLNLLDRAFLIRRLAPYFRNFGKRIVRSPKVYLRDSGLRHAILRIGGYDDLLDRPEAGASWEGYALEEICRAVQGHAEPYFYRTADGAEIDLLLDYGDRLVAIEIKFSDAPALGRGLVEAIKSVAPAKTYIVTPGAERHGKRWGVEVVGLEELLGELGG